MKTLRIAAVSALLGCAALAAPASAQVCVGNCGTATPNGDVSALPNGATSFSYVSTFNGVGGAGQIAGIGGTNGSEARSNLFAANAGEALNFYFNYVTSDGGGQYTDYAFAELLNGVGTHVSYLLTARTQPSGSIIPGQGLPAADATFSPTNSAIIAGKSNFSQLGNDSGRCFTTGCGSTGWIASNYTIGSAGTYQLRFGVTNISDSLFQSALAYSTATVADVPIDGAVPEPASWAMMIGGFGLVGGTLRRRSKVTTRVAYAV